MLRIHKRQSNDTANKQGVILVTILFILAMAMIFISVAIMMTSMTRGRIINRAQDNQCRLTCTSVAEAFYGALQMQEISDADLQRLAGSTVRVVVPTTSVISGSFDQIPGLSSDDDNCTDITFHTDASDASGIVEMTVTIKTVIGDHQQETAFMKLTRQESIIRKSLFDHQVEVYGGGRLGEVRLGFGAPADATDNTFLVRGDAQSPQGTTTYWSDLIITGRFSTGDGTLNLNGDVVFSGPDATLYAPSIRVRGLRLNGDQASGDVFFINNDKSFTGTNTEIFKSPASRQLQIYTLYDEFGTGMGDITTLSSQQLGGAVVSACSSPSDNGDLQRHYNARYHESDTSKTNWDYVVRTMHFDSDCNPTGATALANTLSTATLPTGTYTMSGNYTLGGASGKVTCNLSDGDYVFYITGNTSIDKGYFEFTGNGGKAYFLIKNGVQLIIGNDANVAGIVDTNCFADGTPSSALDQTSRPSVYIFGAGTSSNSALTENNGQLHFAGNSGAVCTAYVGLYESSRGTGDYGSVTAYNASGKTFYGRISAYSFRVQSGAGEGFELPYCPADTEAVDNETYFRIMTKYDISSWSYYS